MSPAAAVGEARSHLNPATWSLSTKLIATVVGLFLAITVVTSSLMVVLLQNSLIGQLDRDVQSTLVRAGGPRSNDGPRQGPGGGIGGPLPGGGGESLILVLRDGVVSVNRVDRGETTGALTRSRSPRCRPPASAPRPRPSRSKGSAATGLPQPALPTATR